MADLSPVRRGDGLLDRLDAETLSVLMQMAREWQAGKFGTGGGREPFAAQGDPISVIIQNRTGAARDQYAIVGISDALVPYATSADEFKRRPQFRATAPSATTPFAVLQQPLANWVSDSTPNTIGRAIISGCTVCKLNVTASGDTYASPTTSTTELTTGTSGKARILAKESGTGAGKWGLVLINNVEPPTAFTYESYYLTSAYTTTNSGSAEVVTGWTNDAGSSTYIDFPSTGLWRVTLKISGNISSADPSGAPVRLYASLNGYNATMVDPQTGTADGVIAAAFAYDTTFTRYYAEGTTTIVGLFSATGTLTHAIEVSVYVVKSSPSGTVAGSVGTTLGVGAGFTTVLLEKLSS